jgi:hypothetical protein
MQTFNRGAVEKQRRELIEIINTADINGVHYNHLRYDLLKIKRSLIIADIAKLEHLINTSRQNLGLAAATADIGEKPNLVDYTFLNRDIFALETKVNNKFNDLTTIDEQLKALKDAL